MKTDSLRQLSLSKREMYFKKGQVVFNEFNSPEGIYAVYSGSLKVFKEGKAGKEQILKFVGPGTVWVIGQFCVISPLAFLSRL